MLSIGSFTTLQLDINTDNVATLELARGAKSNAVNTEMWDELPQVCLILS